MITSTTYFFILGKHPALSAAELAAVFPGCPAEIIAIPAADTHVLLINAGKDLDAVRIMRQLGGTVKLGLVAGQVPAGNRDQLLAAVLALLPQDASAVTGKFHFGFSYYGRKGAFLKALAMETKKYLRGKNISCRWVTSREPTLSSVVVEQNRLLADGAEVVIIDRGAEQLIGRTLAVQPWKELSYRDYGRPARDDHSGMLPPKLAQIMINLASPSGRTLLSGVVGAEKVSGPKAVILDPFCGSGTILTEAMLMGYNDLIGSDTSPKAIEDTSRNINWINEKFRQTTSSVQLFQQSALELSKRLKEHSIDAIITEPYLGPQRGHIDIAKTARELESLYGQALQEFKKILKPGGRVVMIWPCFMTGNNKIFLSPPLHGFKLLNPLPADWAIPAGLDQTGRRTLLYGRPGQKVWREIAVLALN